MTVIFEHDGSVDDFTALALLAADSNALAAVFVTDGDGYSKTAAEVSLKILSLCDKPRIPVGVNQSHITHAFPSAWRDDCLRIRELPILRLMKETDQSIYSPGEELLTSTLKNQQQPLDYLCTGPLTALASVLKKKPALHTKISRVIWMGGAFHENGNVEDAESDGSAEWNSFADAAAAAAILHSGIKLTLCPLDVCHQAPITRDFVTELAQRRNKKIFDFVSSAYALVSYREYFAWDLLTVAYYLWPSLFDTRIINVSIATQGREEGRTIEDDKGMPVCVVTGVNISKVLTNILDTWNRKVQQ